MITGEKQPLIHPHPQIRFTKENSAPLVSRNQEVFKSYGQEYVPIGYHTVHRCTETTKYMLTNASYHNKITTKSGQMMCLFGATNKKDTLSDIVKFCMSGSNVDEDPITQAKVKTYIEKIFKGTVSELEDLKGEFFILAFSPKEGRQSINFVYKDSVENINTFLGNFLKDVSYNNDRIITFNQLLYACYGPRPETSKEEKNEDVNEKEANNKTKSKKENKTLDIPQRVIISLLQCLFSNSQFPAEMIWKSIQNLIKSRQDSKQNPTNSRSNWEYNNLAILNGYTKRYTRQSGKEFIQMENRNTAYKLGEVFCILEERYNKEGRETNRPTLSSKFFGGMLSFTEITFASIMSLMVHCKYYNAAAKALVAELLNSIKTIPKTLNKEEQIAFILGYYNRLFKLNENSKMKKQDEEQNTEYIIEGGQIDEK